MRTPTAALLVLALAAPCQAKNHLWRFTECFSNASGTVQFIEMQECCGSDLETNMDATFIASDANTFAFPNDLTGPTADRWILIATQGFASLPGAPAPDYILPDGSGVGGRRGADRDAPVSAPSSRGWIARCRWFWRYGETPHKRVVAVPIP